jgi:hypothetical protein
MAQPTVPFMSPGDSISARELSKLVGVTVRTVDRILQRDPMAPRPTVSAGGRKRIFSKSQWLAYLLSRQVMPR